MAESTGDEEPTNVWQFLLICFNWIGGRATRLLGIAQGTVALLASMNGLIPENQLKYYLAASALLTFWRGQATSKTYASAQAIVKQNATPDVPLVPNPIKSEPTSP
jgi:hypothetical protein